jgi:hypothetical protein
LFLPKDRRRRLVHWSGQTIEPNGKLVKLRNKKVLKRTFAPIAFAFYLVKTKR